MHYLHLHTTVMPGRFLIVHLRISIAISSRLSGCILLMTLAAQLMTAECTLADSIQELARCVTEAARCICSSCDLWAHVMWPTAGWGHSHLSTSPVSMPGAHYTLSWLLAMIIRLHHPTLSLHPMIRLTRVHCNISHGCFKTIATLTVLAYT